MVQHGWQHALNWNSERHCYPCAHNEDPVIKGLEKRGYSIIDELQEALQPLRLQYQQLTNKDLDDHYDGDTAAMGPKHGLDVIECFYRLTLMHNGGLQ